MHMHLEIKCIKVSNGFVFFFLAALGLHSSSCRTQVSPVAVHRP